MTRPRLILASASPRRLQLLQQAGYLPAQIVAPNINEAINPRELPTDYALRMAREKMQAVAPHHLGDIVITADTVVACGRRILAKAEDEATARACLALLSGRRHRVYTGVCVSLQGKTKETLVMTQVRFSRLSHAELEAYISGGEWHGKAGGYAIQGRAEAFIPWIGGSYSNVVGLPLAETCHMLGAMGVYATA